MKYFLLLAAVPVVGLAYLKFSGKSLGFEDGKLKLHKVPKITLGETEVTFTEEATKPAQEEAKPEAK